MPFLIWRHRQRGVDKRDDRLRKIRRAAIADPLSIAAVDQEARSFESRHVAGHAGLAGAEFPHQPHTGPSLCVPKTLNPNVMVMKSAKDPCVN